MVLYRKGPIYLLLGETMIFYSKASQYALRALSFLVKNQADGPCQTDSIAHQEDIPKHFLSKILQELVEVKILKSTKGPGGGFVFDRDPKTVTLFEVIDCFDNLEVEMKSCAIGWDRCSDRKPCELHEGYKKLRGQVRTYFESINLTSFTKIIDKKRRKRIKFAIKR